MSELIFSFELIDPLVLWGAQNEHFEQIKKHFPKLKLVARGTDLKVLGDEQELKAFEETFQKILDFLNQYNRLNVRDLENILEGDAFARKHQTVSADSSSGSSSAGSEAGDSSAPATISGPAPVPTGPKGDAIVFGPNGMVIRARTPNQRKMVDSLDKNDILFAIGPAGTGKTYTAVALAVRALRNREIKRIILTRPAVEAGENLGFLPGDLKEKIDPYLRPLYDALDDMIPAEKLRGYLENRTIEIAPLAFMRGRTLDNCFVILDEAQNATEMQLKMFLTRMGPTAKFIVTGDVTQIDLPKKQQSGLQNAIKLLDHIEGIDIVYLSGADVVRHRLVKRILEAYGDI